MSQFRDRLGGVLRIPPPVASSREDSGGRHATWLELFFDLVFVVAVAELGSYLHHHLTIRGLLGFAGLFLIVWWVWIGYSYYADLFDTEDLFSRLSMIVAMFVVIFLAQTADDALSGESFEFGAAILVLRAILVVFYYRAQHIRGREQRFVRYFTLSNMFTTFVIGTSLLVPEPGRFGLWAAAVIISLGGVSIIYGVVGNVVVQSSHLPERLGLMTIIVLGETVLAVSFGTSITDPGPMTLAVGALGFFIAVSAWWIYFENYDEHLIDRILHPSGEHWRTARRRGIVYAYSHYLIHMGIVAAGVGIIAMLEASLTDHGIEPGGVGVLCAGVALFLVGSTLCHQALPQGIGRRTRNGRLLVAGSLLVYPGLGIRLSPLVTLGLVAGSLCALIALYNWFPGSTHSSSRSRV